MLKGRFFFPLVGVKKIENRKCGVDEEILAAGRDMKFYL